MKTVKIMLTTMIALMGLVVVSKVSAAQLKALSLTLDDSRPAVASVYTFRFTQVTGASLGRITYEFCKTASGTCDSTNTNLTALDVKPSAVVGLGIADDWAVSHDSQLITALHGTSQVDVTADTALTMAFTGIVNGTMATACDGVSNSDTCFVRITEYSNTAADNSGSWISKDTGTVTYTLVDAVTVTAKVDPTFSFTVTGVNANTVSNGITSSVGSDPITLPFSNLQAGVVRYTMHKLNVATNTQGGYQVTAKMKNRMTGVYAENNIDPFVAPWTAPTTWTAPTGTTANDNTGWFGANTSDTDVANWAVTTAQKFGGIGDSEVQVMKKSSPDNGQEADSVYVTYAISANMYQPSDYYQGTLVYNAVPTY